MSLTLTSNNPLKLTNKFFLHVQPAGKEPLIVQGKYNAECTEYGQLGQIECVCTWSGNVCFVKEVIFLTAEGLEGFEQYIARKNITRMAVVTVSTFRFLRRNDETFKKLIEKETIKAGLTIFQQQTMF
ncbi:MAG TPA: hypothetical protein VEB40_16800 [Flavipsychrobacter sp.]|nr:hypothetical protein [Flavipsychrobacter sp.]